MSLFKFGRKKDVLDLTERYKKQQAKLKEMEEEKKESSSENSGAFNFLGNMASASNQSSDFQTENSEYVDISGDRKRKFAKRLVDMTNKLEDLSNQIYHLQQRVEVLEKKAGV